MIEDLGETKDLATEKPEIVDTMSKALNGWTASVRKSREGADYPK